MAKNTVLQDWIERQRDELQDMAIAASRRYWADHAEQVRRGEKPLHGVIVRRKGGVHITWYRMLFFKKPDGQWGAVKKTLPRHGGYRYTAREFGNDLTPAERRAIEAMEDAAEAIRRQNERLTQIAYRAREFTKRQEALLREVLDEEAERPAPSC